MFLRFVLSIAALRRLYPPPQTSPAEFKEENVAVVSLYPGIVATEGLKNLIKNPAEFESKVRLPKREGGGGEGERGGGRKAAQKASYQ